MLALRGDPPGDPNGEWVPASRGRRVRRPTWWSCCARTATSASASRRSRTSTRARSTIEADTARFVAKCRAGADYAITQMFFDADDYLRLRDRVAAAGCDVPIIAGLMPVTTTARIARSEQLSGAPFPPSLAAKFAAVADDPKAVRALGIDEATRLAQRLLDEGVPGLHFITFNRPRRPAR